MTHGLNRCRIGRFRESLPRSIIGRQMKDAGYPDDPAPDIETVSHCCLDVPDVVVELIERFAIIQSVGDAVDQRSERWRICILAEYSIFDIEDRQRAKRADTDL